MRDVRMIEAQKACEHIRICIILLFLNVNSCIYLDLGNSKLGMKSLRALMSLNRYYLFEILCLLFKF